MTRKIARRRAQIGLSDADYDALLLAQGGGCAICGATPKRTRKDGTAYRLQTDHDHATGKVRGLLCHRCNRALPAWVTSEKLRAMADYLDAHDPKVRRLALLPTLPPIPRVNVHGKVAP